MESDREIVRSIGIVCTAGMKNLAGFALKNLLYASVAGYVTYRVSKRIYINRRVTSEAARLRQEYLADRKLIENSILRWKESTEYRELCKLSTDCRLKTRSVEDYITGLDYDQLIEALQSGELSAYSVLKSYQIKALERTEENNCIVGWILEAEQRARELDLIPAEERGPLHGLPVSIKECFYVKNTYSTAGMIRFLGDKDSRTAPAVQTLIQLGAVPFCKTNVPQAMYSMECVNPLYGTTSNPHNAAREAGGSSGGEGSLIGGGGSMLGLGSDIGGSLRGPAANCGIYSMKPTIGRHISYQDVVESAGPEPAGTQAIAGLMARSPQALIHGWRSVWSLPESQNPQRFDGSIAPLPFNQKMFEKKVKVGFFLEDDVLEGVPGIKRAVAEAVEALQQQGYEVISFPAPDIKEVARLFNGIVLGDINTLNEYLEWDQTSTSLRGILMTIRLLQMPRILRRILVEPLIALFTKLPPLEKIFSTTRELFLGLQDKEAMCRRYFTMMDEAGVDVILCPGQYLPAVPLEVAGTFMPLVLPYLPWNMLNMPAGIAPVSRYSDEDTKAIEAVYPTNDLAYRLTKGYCEGAEGLPLCVQVAAKPFHEEQVLQILNVLHQTSNYA